MGSGCHNDFYFDGVNMPLVYRPKNKQASEYYSDRLGRFISIKEAVSLSEKWGYPKTYAGLQTYIRKCKLNVYPQAGLTLDELICYTPMHQKDRRFKGRYTKATKPKPPPSTMLDEMLEIVNKAIKPLEDVCEY